MFAILGKFVRLIVVKLGLRRSPSRGDRRWLDWLVKVGQNFAYGVLVLNE